MDALRQRFAAEGLHTLRRQADRIGITESAWARIVRGDRSMSRATWESVRRAYPDLQYETVFPLDGTGADGAV